MKRFIIMALLSLTLATTAALAEENNVVVVNGSASREVVPDKINITFSIDTSTAKGKTTLDELERKLIKELSLLNIDCAKQLRVEQMASDLRDYWLRKDKIFTTKSYTLVLNDTESISWVFASLASLGISDAIISSAEVTNYAEIQNQLRQEAMRNAQNKATLLAEAVGQRVGNATQITDYTTDNSGLRVIRNDTMLRSAVMATESGNNTTLEFKSQTITANVNVHFQLYPKSVE